MINPIEETSGGLPFYGFPQGPCRGVVLYKLINMGDEKLFRFRIECPVPWFFFLRNLCLRGGVTRR